MPDSFDANGLQVMTRSEIVAELTTGLQNIYGADINVDQNSPDGQMIGIFAQAAVDLRELLVAINSAFDPDQAVGVILDQRVAINNIKRNGGTYTITPITIVTNATVTLQGLDSEFNDPNGTGYTIEDSSGNQFILIDTTTLTAGSNVLDFRAKLVGLVETTVNTITNPVTIINGVTSVNNPSASLSVGQVEETDPQLHTRREQSVALSSTGFLNGLLGDVLSLDGVTSAVLYENTSGTTDGNGIPGHSMWLIVNGGANSDIANEIYDDISYGAGMKGSVSVPITTASGGVFNALFDRPTAESLYIKFNLKRTVAGFTFNTTGIAASMAASLSYGIGEFADTSTVTAAAISAVAANGGGGVPLDILISSDDVSYTDYLAAPTLATQWTVSATNIAITVE